MTNRETHKDSASTVVYLARLLTDICGDGWRAADGSDDWIVVPTAEEGNHRDYKSEIDSLKVSLDDLQDRYDILVEAYEHEFGEDAVSELFARVKKDKEEAAFYADAAKKCVGADGDS